MHYTQHTACHQWRPSVADHFTQVLHCEHECVRDLATRPGRLSPMENYLPLHYDYLQFAYFKGGLKSHSLNLNRSMFPKHKIWLCLVFKCENNQDGYTQKHTGTYKHVHHKESDRLNQSAEDHTLLHNSDIIWCVSEPLRVRMQSDCEALNLNVCVCVWVNRKRLCLVQIWKLF